MERKKLYYIHEGHAAVYVKVGSFFISQGGLAAPCLAASVCRWPRSGAGVR